MLMRQAMKVIMHAMVTGVVRHRLQVNCGLLVVQDGAQNRFILEVLQSHRCQHLRNLVVQGRQESVLRHLHRSRGTLMPMFPCSRGK